MISESDTKKLVDAFDIRVFLDSRSIDTKQKCLKAININCPFCPEGDDGYHCGIFYIGKRFNCLRCSERGTIFKVLQQLLGISKDAVYEILEGTSVNRGDTKSSITKAFSRKVEEPEQELEEICYPKESMLITNRTKMSWDPLRVFMRHRNITLEKCNKYGVRFCMSGDYANRIILPIHMNGKIVNFQARALVDDIRCAKYLTYTDNTSKLLYGYDDFDAKQGLLVIVEGIFDQWALPQISLGALGSVLSEAQERLIFGLSGTIRRLVLCLDPDVWEKPKVAGNLRKSLGLLRPYFEEVAVAYLPDNKDPDEMEPQSLMRCISEATDIE